MKFTKVLINTTMCLGLDCNFFILFNNYNKIKGNGNVYVWGQHKVGLLGHGINVISLENPTKLETLKYISEVSMSESHAVAVNFSGDLFVWGQGKYGELCLVNTIFCPFPTKMKTSDQREYKKVFCTDLLTCLIDKDGSFSYFGVIIRIFKGSNHSLTLKNIYKDESNVDNKTMFVEKFVYGIFNLILIYIQELNMEKFSSISIGNGFIALLTEKGLVYTIDISDNITLLYSKYFVYSISISNNQIYGLSKENNSSNYYLCKWNSISEFGEDNDEYDSWNTTLFKINDDINPESLTLLDSKNKEILLIFQSSCKLFFLINYK